MYSRVLFCIWISLLLSRVTLLTHNINKRIKSIYTHTELVLPNIRLILIFPSKIWVKRYALYTAKYDNLPKKLSHFLLNSIVFCYSETMNWFSFCTSFLSFHEKLLRTLPPPKTYIDLLQVFPFTHAEL